jgi:hypothetical protein
MKIFKRIGALITALEKKQSTDERIILEISELASSCRALAEASAKQSEYLVQSTDAAIGDVRNLVVKMSGYFKAELEYFERMKRKEAEKETVAPTKYDGLF